MRRYFPIGRRAGVGIILLVILAGGSLVYFFLRKGATQEKHAIVVRGILTQEINVTGKLKAVRSVDLAFEHSGKIAGVYVKIGERVTPGMLMVSLESADLVADRKEQEAVIAGEIAKLDELKKGTRPEEILLQETKVNNMKLSLEGAYRNAYDKIQDAYTKTDDAVRSKSDQLFSNPRSPTPHFNYSFADSVLLSSLEQDRVALESKLNDWRTSLAILLTRDRFGVERERASVYLASVKVFIDKMALAVTSLAPSTSLSQAAIDGYKSDISTARTNVNTAIANLTAADEKIRDADSALKIAQQELELKKAGSTFEAVLAQESKVRQAQAKLESISAGLAKMSLRSPLTGVVTKLEADPGEIAQVNSILVSLISDAALEIEANIPEVDVGQLKVENRVRVVFDALPGEIFSGAVGYIDPAETVIDGVVNFRTTVFLDASNPQFKSGYTANLSIETDKKENVLLLPQIALIERDNGVYVKKQEGGAIREVKIITGLRGPGGIVEILSGLSEGDEVLNIGAKSGQ